MLLAGKIKSKELIFPLFSKSLLQSNLMISPKHFSQASKGKMKSKRLRLRELSVPKNIHTQSNLLASKKKYQSRSSCLLIKMFSKYNTQGNIFRNTNKYMHCKKMTNSQVPFSFSNKHENLTLLNNNKSAKYNQDKLNIISSLKEREKTKTSAKTKPKKLSWTSFITGMNCITENCMRVENIKEEKIVKNPTTIQQEENHKSSLKFPKKRPSIIIRIIL